MARGGGGGGLRRWGGELVHLGFWFLKYSQYRLLTGNYLQYEKQ